MDFLGDVLAGLWELFSRAWDADDSPQGRNAMVGCGIVLLILTIAGVVAYCVYA